MMSMTGFGRGEFTVGERHYRVEARSVNNRFLDVRIRLPWGEGELESRALQLVRSRVVRGRLEVAVTEERSAGAAGQIQLNAGMARDLREALHELAGILGTDLATAARLIPPQAELVAAGLSGPSTEEVWSALKTGIGEALGRLLEMRSREGESTAADLAGHAAELARAREELLPFTQSEPERLRDRLRDRLSRLQLEEPSLTPARLEEEAAILADRCDVSEELARLGSHLEQLRAMLVQPGEVGRKIEFMLQELHRELNTVASKTLTAEVAHRVVAAKAIVERMREQAQNVE